MEREYRYIGKTVPIHDVEDKVQGKMVYAGDMKLHGLMHAKLILSTKAHAKIKNINLDKALSLPGVKRIFTFKDSPDVKYNSHTWFAGAKTTDDEILFTDEPKYVGDRIGAIIAEKKSIAEKALRLIEIEYEELQVVTDPIMARKNGEIAFHKDLKVGDFNSIEDYFIETEDIIETQKVHHAAMETHVAVAAPEKGGIITVWAPCQVAFQARLLISQVLKMPLTKIRVVKSTMGGSFGGKGQPILEMVAAFLAKEMNCPIKLLLNRQESIVSTRTRNAVIGVVKTKAAKDGKILGRDIDMLVDAGAYFTNADAVSMAMGKKSFRMYDLPSQTYSVDAVLTNSPIGGACRGYGSPQIHAVTEIHMDRLARNLGMDPIELRLKNFVEPFAKDPLGGPDLGNARIIECVNEGKKEFNWEERRKTKIADDRYVKAVGMACATHGNGYFGAFQDYLSLYARLDEDGKVFLNAGFHDQGCGTITTMAQIVAEIMDMSIEDIYIPEVDTSVSPFDSAGTQASRVTYVCGQGAYEIAVKLKNLLFESFAKIKNVKVKAVSASEGWLFIDGEKICQYSDAVIEIQNKLSIDISESHKYQAKANPAVYAVNFAEVEIDKLTGLVRVTDALAVHDIGQAINRGFVEGQIQGAIQMGIGYALSEEIELDGKGNIKSDTFAKYHVVNMPDMPKVKVLLIEEPDANGPFGAKSVGEISTCAMAPAVINAIEHGLGIEIEKLPATPERILKALGDNIK